MANTEIIELLKNRFPSGVFMLYRVSDINGDNLPEAGADTGVEVTRFSPAVFEAECISEASGKTFDSDTFDIDRCIFSVNDNKLMGILYAETLDENITLVYDSWLAAYDTDTDREGRMYAALLKLIQKPAERNAKLIIRIPVIKYANKYRRLLGEGEFLETDI